MKFYIGLDGHWYLREGGMLLWRSPWRSGRFAQWAAHQGVGEV